MRFIKSNPHPTGKKIGDCVVRAIAIAEAKKWIDVYSELCEIGKQVYDMPNSKKVYEEYLSRHGWKKQKMPKNASGKRLKLNSFAESVKGIAVINVVKHLATVENGTLLDTWDCGNKCVGNYYTK